MPGSLSAEPTTFGFRTFVCALSGRRMLSPEALDQVLAALSRLLVFELRRRGLWHTPPRYLGIFGGNTWADPMILDELAFDCYVYVFVERLRGLRRQAAVRESIDGLVALSVRHFVHDAQRRNDPLGYRIFEVVHAAATALVDGGDLFVLAGDARIRNPTVLGFAPGGTTRPQPLDPGTIVAWNDNLMPGLVTAWHRGAIVDELVRCLHTLPGLSVEAFRFRDVVHPLKEDARRRWRSLFDSVAGEDQAADTSRALRTIVRAEPVGFEAREHLRTLSHCIRRGIDDESEDPREREQLSRMFDVLIETSAALEEGAPPPPPSLRSLAAALALPRSRTRHLRTTLEALAAACTRARPGRSGGGRPLSPLDETHSREEIAMAMDTRMLLRRRTRDVLATEDETNQPGSHRLGEDVPTAPGDVMLFADPAQPIEWMWLSGNTERAQLVPVDQAPFYGPKDVVLEGIEGERVVVRPSIIATVSSMQLARATRSFTLPASALDRVRQRANDIDPRPKAKGIESSSAHRDWIEGLRAAAQSLEEQAEATPSSTVMVMPSLRPRGRSGVFVPWLAAALAIIAFGLGMRVWVLNRDIDLGQQPQLVQTDQLHELRLGSRDRTDEVLHIEADGHWVSLFIVLRDLPPSSRYHLRLRREGVGGSAWTSTTFGRREQQLQLPVGDAPVRWHLEILGLEADGTETVLDTRSLNIVPISSSQ